MTVEEANRRAMEEAEKDRSFVQNPSARMWAKRLRCSLGLISKLPFWQTTMQETGRSNPGRRSAPKTVSLTATLEQNLAARESREERLEKLVAEQKADDGQRRVYSRERI
jgi:hypothetical protein